MPYRTQRQHRRRALRLLALAKRRIFQQRVQAIDADIQSAGVPEPETRQSCERTIGALIKLHDEGKLECLSVYAGMRNGTYTNFQTASHVGRHEDAGRILELAIMRLGFTQPVVGVMPDDEDEE